MSCPVEITLNLIGSKWKVLILRDLLRGPKRFGELHRGIKGISQKMLTQHLREMERDGLVNRKVFAEIPPRVEYSLTETGQSLKPILEAMHEWGSRYNQSCN
ncbi:winged helix-turn-helix transcriptional regulator [Zhaonella formicivorans]|jgi:DNA-binding HxlR family transcriptional regulator|uniref:winged helix-turn-helix transcriptional regulator n=1 Tax=Zhaonella formicivorans TaxID=2528593 RepID=UPI0010EAA1B6|nr:helix-turn-helix domain-containing protein [Zhaonella formicivorans]